ncbi:alpha-L-fucosidase-domain-containing protein, partial [Baffinella frigidus]
MFDTNHSQATSAHPKARIPSHGNYSEPKLRLNNVEEAKAKAKKQLSGKSEAALPEAPAAQKAKGAVVDMREGSGPATNEKEAKLQGYFGPLPNETPETESTRLLAYASAHREKRERKHAAHREAPKYQASPESLTKHKAPAWFNNAKLGIFIHWGVYSVPAWAPLSRRVLGGGDSNAAACTGSWWNCNPYSEWYGNTMHIANSPTAAHHKEKWGDKKYGDFASMFEHDSEKWDAGEWGKLFKEAGARYAVLTTKHHDG